MFELTAISSSTLNTDLIYILSGLLGKSFPVLIPTIIAVWGTIEAFLRRYEQVISYLTRGIEKYSADGQFTAEEKEQLAVDTWRDEIKPNLPVKLWWIKLIPNPWIEKWIKKTIAKICEKSNKIKVVDNLKK